jgi:hypothetical protein
MEGNHHHSSGLKVVPKEKDDGQPSKSDTADVDEPPPQFAEAMSASLESRQRYTCKERTCSADEEEE